MPFDATGRVIREDKRGYIPGETPRILERLNIEPEQFIATTARMLQQFSTAIGTPEYLTAHCVTRNVEAAPDFVGLSDVADLIGVTRQNMRKLMLSHADTFPPPVHGGSTLIWHLDDVLDWLSARGRYPVAETTLETVRLLRQLNLAREARHLKPDVVQILDTYLV